jgi:hypothetical protein
MANTKLEPDPTGIYPSCAHCMHHRAQVKLVREANFGTRRSTRG